ncbi:hypothetical protein BBJ28_00013591 [Nothophytophthora sp. Chile5]|nr:hypothetical protein BBJ28_00013591 [Nothophytophthora sp. Chile5]
MDSIEESYVPEADLAWESNADLAWESGTDLLLESDGSESDGDLDSESDGGLVPASDVEMESSGEASASDAVSQHSTPVDAISQTEKCDVEFMSGHPLFDEASRVMENTLSRLEPSTRTKYSQALKRWQGFCIDNDLPDALTTRFYYMPTVLMIFLYRSTEKTKSSSPAEIVRYAISWYFKTPAMLADGQPQDVWIVERDAQGKRVGRGNPAQAYIVQDTCRALRKDKKKKNKAKRAVAMDVKTLAKILTFVTSSRNVHPSLSKWLPAVASMA